MVLETKKNKFRFKFFFDELLLYSGQFALFYIILNLSLDRLNFFNNFGHFSLLVILIIQTYLLSVYGKEIKYRLIFSFLTPTIYFLIESREGLEFILNTAHIGFWIFTIITTLLQIMLIKYKNNKYLTYFLDFLHSFINITIFIFLYFYFDLKLSLLKNYNLGLIDYNTYLSSLEFDNLLSNFILFLNDPAHIYLLICGLLISITIGRNRLEILKLNDNLSDIFGKYVDVNIKDKILNNSINIKNSNNSNSIVGDSINSEKKNLVILFSDIRNFTKNSEHSSPCKIVDMLNIYFEKWIVIIEKNGGIIDKFIGDAIMSIFDSKKEISCSNSVLSSIEMLDSIDEINQKLKQKKLPLIENIGIGINYGEVIFGDIGGVKRKNFTVIGDSVNVASRLESYCKELKCRLIISKSVYMNLQDSLKKKFIKHNELIKLKGKTEGVELFIFKE